MNEQAILQLLYPISAVVAGFAVCLWRLYSVVSRVIVLENQIQSMSKKFDHYDEDMREYEQSVSSKLDMIDQKLDNFILKMLELGTKHGRAS